MPGQRSTQYKREVPHMGGNISDARTTDRSLGDMLMTAIVETVAETGLTGAPSGVIYAAMMQVGVTLDLYNALISKIKDHGYITESNNVLHATQKGRIAALSNSIVFGS